jgi:hypothetical protein
METGNIQDEEKQDKKTTQYALDTTMRKQTQITYRRHETPTNHWRQRRTEHRFMRKSQRTS